MDQFKSLADRFRRAVARDNPRLSRDASIEAARAVKRAVESGRLSLDAIIPWPDESDHPATTEPQWHVLWAAVCGAVCHAHPDVLPLNPHALVWQASAAAAQWIGKTDPADWQRNAEHYATVCDWIADDLARVAGRVSHNSDVGGNGPPAPSPIFDFVPGMFLYRGQAFPLTGKPWEVLQAFAGARQYARTANQLRDLWPDAEADDKTIKQTVSTVRAALRKAIEEVDARRGKFDPILNVGQGARNLAWRLELAAK